MVVVDPSITDLLLIFPFLVDNSANFIVINRTLFLDKIHFSLFFGDGSNDLTTNFVVIDLVDLVVSLTIVITNFIRYFDSFSFNFILV